MKVKYLFAAVFVPLAICASGPPSPLAGAPSGVVRSASGAAVIHHLSDEAVAGRGIADRFIIDAQTRNRRYEIFEDSLVSNPDNRLIMPRGLKPSEMTAEMLPGGHMLLKAQAYHILVRNQFTFVPRHVFGVQHVDFEGASLTAKDLFRLAHANYENVPTQFLQRAGIYRGWGDQDVIRIGRDVSNATVFQTSLSRKPRNVLQLGPGLSPKTADIWTFQTDGYVLSFPSGPRITLEHMLRSREDVTYGVQIIRFDDGTVWTADSIISRLNKLALAGKFGELTDDTRGRVLDTHGNRILWMVKAHGGGDTIVYRRGYGSMSVLEEDTSDAPNNTLVFGPRITQGDVRISVNYAPKRADLILSLRRGADQVTLQNALGNRVGHTFGVQRVRFSDGTEWTYADLLTRAGATTSKITSIGDSQANVLRVSPIGASSNGGGGGGDTFLYDLSDGRAVVNEQDTVPHPANRLRLGAGITPESITVLRDTGDGIYLHIDERHGISIPFARSAELPLEFGVQVVEFANGKRWSNVDMIRMANANPLFRNQFDAKLVADRRARQVERDAEMMKFEQTRVEVIYEKFMADLDVGLARLGLSKGEVDRIHGAAKVPNVPFRACNPQTSATVKARELYALADQLDLRYGTSQVDTALSYMRLDDRLTRENELGLILAALRGNCRELD